MVETSSCVHNEISCKVARLSLNIFIESVPRPDLCIYIIYMYIYIYKHFKCKWTVELI